MRKRHAIIVTALAALLFVGSGCTESDALTVLEIMEGVTWDEAGARTTFGISTGDKDKDRLIDVADNAKHIQEAAELEEEAAAAVAKKPSDYKTAREKLEAAIKIRPNDYSLRNQLGVLRIEQGMDPESAFIPGGKATCTAYIDPAKNPREFNRCHRKEQADWIRRLDESANRAKSRDQTVPCATYQYIMNAAENEGSTEDFDGFVDWHDKSLREKYRHASAMLRTKSCSGPGKNSAPPPT